MVDHGLVVKCSQGLFSLKDKLQIFKILPKSSDNIQKVDTVCGKVYISKPKPAR